MRPELRLAGLPTMEVRSVPCEVRMEASADGRRVVRGHAAVFNSRSAVLRGENDAPFVETILPGAFARTLAESDVRALYNHDDAYLLGRRGAGTLRLAEDSTGLAYEIDLGNRSYDRDLEESLARGDVFGASFSFAAFDDEWSEGEGGVALRTLRGVHLFDVGPVVFPAYRAATATLRALKGHLEARAAREAEAEAAAERGPALVARFNQFLLDDFS